MTQAEYEVEYAKLCDRYNALLRLNRKPSGETAGEMTAEQFEQSEEYANMINAGYPSDWHSFAEAFAKQRVEQVERQNQTNAGIIKAAFERENALAAKVADLERERIELQAFKATFFKVAEEADCSCDHSGDDCCVDATPGQCATCEYEAVVGKWRLKRG